MASFDLNNFIQNYKSYNTNSYTAAGNGRDAQEKREIQQAEEAVKGNSFLSLTLSGKLSDALLEIGVGPRVAELVKGTAVNAAKELVNPFTEYLKKYEFVLDEKEYKKEFNKAAMTMFFAHQAMAEEIVKREGYLGNNLVIDS